MQDNNHPKVLFVVNPIAGKSKQGNVINKINALGKVHMNFQIEVFIWKTIEQKQFILDKIKKNNYDRVIAVGGDGTINLIASAIVNHTTKLGIIPVGSGNGLARHLNIPFDIDMALNLAFSDKELNIDVGMVNNQAFVCTTGLGFDAYVAHEFAKDREHRGLISYVKKSIKAFFTYKANRYELIMDGEKVKVKALLLTIANTNQYGNNAYIAPKAKLRDGKLNVVIVKPIPLFAMPIVIHRLFRKKINTSKYVTIFKAKRLYVSRTNIDAYHYDGEPKTGGNTFSFSVRRQALTVLSYPVN